MKRYLGKGAVEARRDGDGLAVTWLTREEPRAVDDNTRVQMRAALTYEELSTGDVVVDVAGRWRVTEVRPSGVRNAPTLYEVDLTRLAS